MRRIVAFVFAAGALAVIATPGAAAQQAPSENASCAAQYTHFFGPPGAFRSTEKGPFEFPFGQVAKHVAVEHGRGTLEECLVEVP